MLFVGPAIEVASGENLTHARQDELARLEWKNLPLGDGLVWKKGKGERHLAVFTDPSCPYCKHLEEEFAKLDNVTIHYLLVSFLGSSS